MHYLGGLRVKPQLPSEIARLKELAHNLYFAWHPEVKDLFIAIDRELWKKTNHNPVKFLNEVQQKKIDTAARDNHFIENYRIVLAEFDNYMSEKSTWFSENPSPAGKFLVAYFTAEFGFHECLPIYAGGLGVLAGDHMKSASDLGIPIVGISLFYYQSYFTQEIDTHGNQIALYHNLNPLELPLLEATDRKGNPIHVEVPLAHRNIIIRAWEARVGRRSAYLLDTNIPENSPADREITSRLYGGDQEMRIAQEIVLGMGGTLLLGELGIEPSVWHMNEGHSVFLVLQRIQDLVQKKELSFNEALEVVTSNTIFTTHTPVPAGNDAFPLHIKDKYFQKYWESVGIRRHQFMELGSQVQPEGYEIFNLTVLAFNLSRYRNAVSRLHGEVSQNLWKTVWPDLPPYEVPITYITNGVHAGSWVSRKYRTLYEKYLRKEWLDNQDNKAIWEKLQEIPDEELWRTKLETKKKLFNHIRERLSVQYERNKIGTLQMIRVKQHLKPNVLTIGFARRFATYKRGTLIFRNPERLKRILNHPEHPVQLIFAGKAHPKDIGGQDLIRQIYNLSLQPDVRGRILFIENYDMGLARDLVSGVDVWLNNPRRTQEASGTSGQKVGMNGGINFSVLDGWWNEGFSGENGWAFGDQENYETLEEWDSWDSEELYDILEHDIIPLYYRQDSVGIPHDWIAIMRNSMQSILPIFNTHRMSKEYMEKLYRPAHSLGLRFRKANFQTARQVSNWKARIDQNWFDVQLEPLRKKPGENGFLALNFGDKYQVEARVKLGSLKPEDVKVQIFLVRNNMDLEEISDFEIFDMQLIQNGKKGAYTYKTQIKPSDSGNYYYTLRVLPYHRYLPSDIELGVVKWYQS